LPIVPAASGVVPACGALLLELPYNVHQGSLVKLETYKRRIRTPSHEQLLRSPQQPAHIHTTPFLLNKLTPMDLFTSLVIIVPDVTEAEPSPSIPVNTDSPSGSFGGYCAVA